MELEWLILADGAQVVQDKLYLIGGGWDTINVSSEFPILQHLSVAAAFRVPWNETNQAHNVELEIADQDAQSLVKLGGKVEVGRPPGLPLGHTQRVQLAVDTVLPITKAGTYVILARVEGQDVGQVVFNVVSPKT